MKFTEQKLPSVVVAGTFQNGKSTLVNCLLDDKYAPMGNGLRTTSCCACFRYGEAEIAQLVNREGKITKILDRREDIFCKDFHYAPEDHLEITCWKPLLMRANVVDTPGFDANSADNHVAETALDNADIVVFVHAAKQQCEEDRRILHLVKGKGKRLLFLFNCKQQTPLTRWNPADDKNQPVCDAILSQLIEMDLERALIEVNGKKIWSFNPIFAWYALGHQQRDLDSKDKNVCRNAQDMIDTIEAYCKKIKIPDTMRKEKLLQQSGVLEIRKAIENVSFSLLDQICSDPAAEIKRISGLLAARIRTIIKAEKETDQK